MAINQRKTQKKLLRKKAKRKAMLAAKKAHRSRSHLRSLSRPWLNLNIRHTP